MSSYIEEKLKEFDERFYSLEKIEIFQHQNGTATQEFVSYESGVREFIKQALQEQGERIIKKIKSLPRYTFLTDKREFTKQDVISREKVIELIKKEL